MMPTKVVAAIDAIQGSGCWIRALSRDVHTFKSRSLIGVDQNGQYTHVHPGHGM